MFRSKLAVTSALLVVASIHTGSWALSKHEENHSSSSAPVQTDRPREVEVVTITPDGFEPQEIVRPAGPFLLSVSNRSGIDSLDLHLETEQRGKLREKSLPRETPHWREVINLQPGRYVVTEANHPEWTFSLIIQ